LGHEAPGNTPEEEIAGLLNHLKRQQVQINVYRNDANDQANDMEKLKELYAEKETKLKENFYELQAG
jgi:ATP-dependent helicase/DNAse subunit B